MTLTYAKFYNDKSKTGSEIECVDRQTNRNVVKVFGFTIATDLNT